MKHTATMRCLLAAGLLLATAGALAADNITTATPQPVTLGGILHADSDDTLAFTPDGHTVFFDRSAGKRKTIMVSHKIDGRWSQPAVANFSGRWYDQDPVMAPDGSYLLLGSDRPPTPGGQPLTQDYFGVGARPGSNLWRVDRLGDGWGQPVWLGAVVNSDPFVVFGSIAADGSLYFLRFDRAAKAMHTWHAAYRDGHYLPPVRAGLGDAAVSTHDPAVAPDQSFIVFDYGKTKGGLGRLCIAFREGDHWGRPIDLGDVVNKDMPWGSHVSADGRSVFFTGQTQLWRLALTPWLRSGK